jgi:hypothetical protein
MGTNYYIRDVSEICQHCKQPQSTDYHIGKRSSGWVFSLHVTDDIPTLSEIQSLWEYRQIEDEYGNVLSADKMLEIIKTPSTLPTALRASLISTPTTPHGIWDDKLQAYRPTHNVHSQEDTYTCLNYAFS